MVGGWVMTCDGACEGLVLVDILLWIIIKL